MEVGLSLLSLSVLSTILENVPGNNSLALAAGAGKPVVNLTSSVTRGFLSFQLLQQSELDMEGPQHCPPWLDYLSVSREGLPAPDQKRLQ